MSAQIVQSTNTVPASIPAATDDSLDHIVCCDDDEGTYALCGRDTSQDPWVQGEMKDEDTCATCLHLDRTAGCDACPLALFGREA